MLIRLQETESGRRESPALSQASHQGLQHDDPETWLNIEEDLVGAGVDAASVGSEHDLIKRFVNNVWAGGDANNSGAQSEELEEDGPDDHSNGQNEGDGKFKGDSASVQDSKKKINDFQEIDSRQLAPKQRFMEDSNLPMVDFRNKDVIRDLEYQKLWDRVTNDMERARSRRDHAYQNVKVLLLCWDQSCTDMAIETEAQTLRAVFETHFGYHTTVEYLNNQSERTRQAQLNCKVAVFVANHDGPDTLFIIYYSGYGAVEADHGDLFLLGLVSKSSDRFYLY